MQDKKFKTEIVPVEDCRNAVTILAFWAEFFLCVYWFTLYVRLPQRESVFYAVSFLIIIILLGVIYHWFFLKEIKVRRVIVSYSLPYCARGTSELYLFPLILLCLMLMVVYRCLQRTQSDITQLIPAMIKEGVFTFIVPLWLGMGIFYWIMSKRSITVTSEHLCIRNAFAQKIIPYHDIRRIDPMTDRQIIVMRISRKSSSGLPDSINFAFFRLTDFAIIVDAIAKGAPDVEMNLLANKIRKHYFPDSAAKNNQNLTTRR